jgi:hypothetical protein
MKAFIGRSRMRLTAVVGALAIACATGATIASAQVDQDGLVNVAIVDTQVAVPVAVAANICDVNVGVLAQQERTDGAACDADAQSMATHNQGPNGGSRDADQGGTEQDGLVNVLITGTQIAVPVSVAANVCDVNVGILARQLRIGETVCNADADSMATKNQGPNGGGRTLP